MTTEEKRAYHKAYRERNREKLKEYQREYHKRNPEYRKEYRERNPGYFKAFYEAHKEKFREYNKNAIAKLKAKGLCTQCRKPKEQDRIKFAWCNNCKMKYNRMAVERRKRNKENGF